MKKISMFVIAALCAISLSSCGDDSSSSSNNANPGASSSASLSPSASASTPGSSYDTAIQLTTDKTIRNIATAGKVYFYVDATSSTRYIFKDTAWDNSKYSATVFIDIQNSSKTNVETSIDVTSTAAGISGTTTTPQRYYFVADVAVHGTFDLYLQNN
jgi:hypothetical protein